MTPQRDLLKNIADFSTKIAEARVKKHESAIAEKEKE
jgi:hypothetical protein